ncbi:MAG: nucleotide exchange factor GrpE, partial [Candidatus Nanoarchaeia archaeon]
MIKMTSNNAQKSAKNDLQEKIEKLQKDLEERTKLAEERLSQLKYLQADFDNYRKNFEKEKEKIIELANESLIKELLTVVDDFERVVQSMENEKNREGLVLLHKNFFKVLENYGLKRIGALGKKFDHYFHEALLKEKSDKEDGIILEEL